MSFLSQRYASFTFESFKEYVLYVDIHEEVFLINELMSELINEYSKCLLDTSEKEGKKDGRKKEFSNYLDYNTFYFCMYYLL